MAHELSAVPLPPGLRAALVKAGFRSTSDFDGVSVIELARGEEPMHMKLFAHAFSATNELSGQNKQIDFPVSY